MNVVHDASVKRFVVTLDEGHGVLRYEMQSPSIMNIFTTMVPHAARKRGVGAELVHAAFEYARSHNLKVIPTCSYAAHWVSTHPEYQDLVNAHDDNSPLLNGEGSRCDL